MKGREVAPRRARMAFAWRDPKGRSDAESLQLVGDVMRWLPASGLWLWCTKPTKLIVQLFAHAFTVSNTWGSDDFWSAQELVPLETSNYISP